MNKVFCGTLLSYAKTKIKNIEPLLIRADNGFLFERSIDEAVKHLNEIQLILLKAKQSYIEQIKR
jgi:prefoldin subunit 5